MASPAVPRALRAPGEYVMNVTVVMSGPADGPYIAPAGRAISVVLVRPAVTASRAPGVMGRHRNGAVSRRRGPVHVARRRATLAGQRGRVQAGGLRRAEPGHPWAGR